MNLKEPQLAALTEAIAILENCRKESTSINFAWNKLQSAGLHLQKQITRSFAPEEL